MKPTPELTMYALGKLSEEEKSELLSKLLADGLTKKEIDKEVKGLREIDQVITAEFKKDELLRLNVEKREGLFPKERIFTWKKIMTGMGISFAGLAAFIMVRNYNLGQLNQSEIGPVDAIVMGESFSGVANSQKVTPSRSKMMAPHTSRVVKKTKSHVRPVFKGIEANIEEGGYKVFSPAPIAKEEYNRENYQKIDTNPYTLVSTQPLSTFSVDVDTASYANMRRFLYRGALPPKDSIRVEELINYFDYKYDIDFKKHPVGIKVDQSISPWNKKRKIVRVALKADSPSKLMTAKKNLVFLMDVSGSMSDPKKLPLLSESIKLLVRKLKSTDTVSIVVYAGAAGVVLDATEAKEKVKIYKALQNLSAGGSTNGGEGIKAAYKIAKQNFVKGGVNRIILATDGDFNVGTSSESALIDLIEEKAKDDIFLTVVGLGMGNYQDSLLEQISNRGNGNYAYIDSLQEANKLFNIDLEKNLTTVAKDVKVQVEFNPNKVQAYRLIGYENRMLAVKDFNDDKKDDGEMGAGHNVTAIYEIILPSEKIDLPKVDKLKYQKEIKKNTNSDELLTVKVRYKNPTEDKSTKFDVVLNDENKAFDSMDTEFRFALAVASFGMKLRGDKLVKDLTYRDIESMAKEAKGDDRFGFRQEFIELIDFAKQVDK